MSTQEIIIIIAVATFLFGKIIYQKIKDKAKILQKKLIKKTKE